jgi:hypothetical protein
MNKIANNIPNKIKQPAQCCVYCGRTYKKRLNLDKHIVLCELLQKSKKTSINYSIEEDEEQIPSQRKMFHMLLELGNKFTRLEGKIEEINKWVIKKKKKINVLEWLNTNLKPNVTFDQILDKIIVSEKDIVSLFENTFYDVLNEIFSNNIYQFNENENPIFAFVQKPNTFYIYDKDGIWKELSREILIKFLNKIHLKIIKCFYDCKKTKTNEIKMDDSFAIKFNKTSVKIMSIEFKQESILSRITSQMYSKMKTDMKALIEYDFEF